MTGRENRWARRREVQAAKLIDETWCLPPLETFPLVADRRRFPDRRPGPSA